MMIFGKGRKTMFLVLGILLMQMFIYTTVVSSEMRVTTKDGRTHTLPVNSVDVKNIEFTDAKNAYGNYLGCFKDEGVRDLSGPSLSSGTMTTEQCISTCAEKGFSYAGTQIGSACFCGNSYGKYGSANNCNMKCAGNPNQTCGGAAANCVYSVK